MPCKPSSGLNRGKLPPTESRMDYRRNRATTENRQAGSDMKAARVLQRRKSSDALSKIRSTTLPRWNVLPMPPASKERRRAAGAKSRS